MLTWANCGKLGTANISDQQRLETFDFYQKLFKGTAEKLAPLACYRDNPPANVYRRYPVSTTNILLAARDYWIHPGKMFPEDIE